MSIRADFAPPASASSEQQELEFLYPASKPDDCGMLAVGAGHDVWWEASGNPRGVPVIYLHGGPGVPCQPIHRRFFDPAFYRIVLMHQRGCGRSTPLGSLVENTTNTLISDIERLRIHLGIERWLVVGGSWGSCLALAYGQTHPRRCLGFRLRGVLLGRNNDIDWWWKGTRMLFPDAYEDLLSFLPEAERADPMRAYCGRLIDSDSTIFLPAARSLKSFSARTVHVRPNAAKIAEADLPEVSVPMSRIFAHYTLNRFFLEDQQLLRNLHCIVHLPCAIVQGRFDVTTPAEGAWTLHKAWPGSSIRIIPEGAHDELDRPLARAVLESHEALKASLS